MKKTDGPSVTILDTAWVATDTIDIDYAALEASTDYTLSLNPTGSGQFFRSSDNVRLPADTTISFTTATP